MVVVTSASRALRVADAGGGYDRREVDKVLRGLGDWIETDAARDLGDQAVMRKLELVGKSTAQILLATEKESEELRAQRRSSARSCAPGPRRRRARRGAPRTQYAKKVREQADQDARRTGESASAKAKGIVERAERRRAQIEAAIAELDARRGGALRELERLQGELASTIGEHKPGAPTRARGQRGRRGEGGRSRRQALGDPSRPADPPRDPGDRPHDPAAE